MNKVARLLPPPALILIGVACFIIYDRQKFNPQHIQPDFEVYQTEPLAQNETVYVSFEEPLETGISVTWINNNTPFLMSRQPWRAPVVADDEIEEPQHELVEPVIPEILEAPLPRLQLLGVLVDGGSPRALIGNLDSGTETWVAVGQEIEGWSVSKIQPRQVKLTLNGQEIIAIFRE